MIKPSLLQQMIQQLQLQYHTPGLSTVHYSHLTLYGKFIKQHVVLQCTNCNTARYGQGYRRLSRRAYGQVIGVVDVNLAQSLACHFGGRYKAKGELPPVQRSTWIHKYQTTVHMVKKIKLYYYPPLCKCHC